MVSSSVATEPVSLGSGSSVDDPAWLQAQLPEDVICTWNRALDRWGTKDAYSVADAQNLLRLSIADLKEPLEANGWKLLISLKPAPAVDISVLSPLSDSVTFHTFLHDPRTGAKIFAQKPAPPAVSAVRSARQAGVDDAFKEAFDSTPFVNPSAAARLRRVLSKFAVQWSKSPTPEWYAPFVALINSSMTGKSRLLVELRNLGVFLMCVCFRADANAKYRPPRTPKIADWATGKVSTKLDVPFAAAVDPLLYTKESCAFILACLTELRVWLQEMAYPGGLVQEEPVAEQEVLLQQNQQPGKSPGVEEQNVHDHLEEAEAGAEVDEEAETDEEMETTGVQPGVTLRDLARSWFEKQTGADAETFWVSVWSKMAVEASRVKGPPYADGYTGSTKALDSVISIFEQKVLGEKLKIARMLTKLGVNLDPEQLHVLFVFDEIGQLDESLRHLSDSSTDEEDLARRSRLVLLRRALRCIPATSTPTACPQIFCVITDTTSEVATLAPVSVFDNSYRLRVAGKKLFPPLTLTFSLDVWWDAVWPMQLVEYSPPALVQAPGAAAGPPTTHQTGLLDRVLESFESAAGSWTPVGAAERKRRRSEWRETFLGGLTLEVMSSAKFMALFGRPIFTAFLLKIGTEDAELAVSQLLDFLRLKLLKQFESELPGKVGNKPEKELEMDEELVADFGEAQNERIRNPRFFTQAQILGVLGSIASVEVNAGSRLASTLMSDHLRLAAAISKLRRYVYTFEVSEPLLALAAHNLIMAGVVPWSVILDKFNATQLNNSTAVGFRGELAFQALALMATQEKLRSYIEPPTRNQLTSFPAVPAVKFMESLLGGRLTGLEKSALEQRAQVEERNQTRLGHDKPSFIDTICLAIRSLEAHGFGSVHKWQVLPQVNDQSLQRVLAKLGGEGELRSDLKNAVAAVNSASAWRQLKKDFAGGKVRLFQFVKAMGEVTKEMLVEFFIRGSAIVCRNNESVADIIIPVFFSATDCDVISPDKMGAIVVQVKLRSDFVADGEKVEWLKNTDKLYFLAGNPSIGLFCELGPARGAEVAVPDSAVEGMKNRKRQSLPSELAVTLREGPVSGCKFGLFSRRLSVRDIRPADDIAEEAFQRLLESFVDPSNSLNVDALFRADIREMFKVQPYMNSEGKWDSSPPQPGKKAKN